MVKQTLCSTEPPNIPVCNKGEKTQALLLPPHPFGDSIRFLPIGEKDFDSPVGVFFLYPFLLAHFYEGFTKIYPRFTDIDDGSTKLDAHF